MKRLPSTVTTLSIILITAWTMQGCFGPFASKKKSSGGGGSSEKNSGETSTDTSTSTKTSTPSGPASPPAPATPGAEKPVDGYGCLQGVVTDGFTGQRVDLSKVTGTNGMYVLIRGDKLKAQIIADDPNLLGEYHICGIPVEDTYPVYAYIDGYMPFESSVMVDSTRAKKVTGNQAVVDEVKIPDPIELQDVRLFPVGNTTRNLRVRAVFNGVGVKDAIVDLEAKAAGSAATFAFEGTFANSAGTRVLPTRQMTDADGYATFPAAGLSLGAAYAVTVHPPIASNNSAPAHADIVLGVSGASASDFNSYDLNVILGDQNQGLKAISCSTQFQSYNSSGTLKIMFNRPVNIIDQDNLDGALAITAGMVSDTAGTTTVTLVSDTADNDKVESLTATMSGNILSLTPKFTNDKGPIALDPNVDPNNTTINSKNKDGTATWTFSKVLLDVAGDEYVNKVGLDTLIGAVGQIACPSVVRFFQQIN